MNLFELARRFINTESITGNEAGFARMVRSELEKAGFIVNSQQVADDRVNLLAVTEAAPRVILCTHLDTVPPFIPASEDHDYIYGRGACDVKGILAAMLVAGKELLDSGVRDFGFLFVCGEEVDSIGARKSNELEIHSDYVIVGEPTENKLAAGHKGILAFQAKARGRAGHSSFPNMGESAIDKLIVFLENLRAAALPTDPVLGAPTVNIGQLAGGVAHNVIPEFACATISIRATTETGLVKKVVDAVAGDEIEIGIIARSEPQRLHMVEGFGETVVPFCTDIPHLKNWGTALLIGPGDPRTAHTANERISKSQLQEAVEIYKALVRRLLAQSN